MSSTAPGVDPVDPKTLLAQTDVVQSYSSIYATRMSRDDVASRLLLFVRVYATGRGRRVIFWSRGRCAGRLDGVTEAMRRHFATVLQDGQIGVDQDTMMMRSTMQSTYDNFVGRRIG
ncbi:hypothetical protein EI94DRAFT_1785864 [Lactarius quietus]|nr:hypothetical protein EI94DRAFT_1785864 [Lactarius quietus]